MSQYKNDDDRKQSTTACRCMTAYSALALGTPRFFLRCKFLKCYSIHKKETQFTLSQLTSHHCECCIKGSLFCMSYKMPFLPSQLIWMLLLVQEKSSCNLNAHMSNIETYSSKEPLHQSASSVRVMTAYWEIYTPDNISLLSFFANIAIVSREHMEPCRAFM